jgi:hypothetical protein
LIFYPDPPEFHEGGGSTPAQKACAPPAAREPNGAPFGLPASLGGVTPPPRFSTAKVKPPLFQI